jgi:hypothetical protein
VTVLVGIARQLPMKETSILLPPTYTMLMTPQEFCKFEGAAAWHIQYYDII